MEPSPVARYFDEGIDVALEHADDESADEDADEALRSAGQALGVPDWIDPDTGELADDERTRTDEH